jgi:hypothetical protein
MSGDDKLARLHDYMERVERHLMSIPTPGVVQEGPLTLLEVGRMYSRCRSMFLATRLLVEHSLAEDAVILGRSLFETSIRIEYLVGRSELDREALVLQRFLDGLTEFERLTGVQAPNLVGGPGLSPEDAEVLKKQRDAIVRRQGRLGIRKLLRFPSDKQMAVTLGREREFLDFETSHQFVHGSLSAHESRTKYPDPQTMYIFTRNDDYEMRSGVGASVARTTLRALAAAGTMLGWATSGTDELIAESETYPEISRHLGA